MQARTGGDPGAGTAGLSRAARWACLGALGVVAVVAVWLLGPLAGDVLLEFTARVESVGAWAPALYLAGYMAATVALVPGSVLTLAAGALFGVVEGTAYALAGATLGAAAAFLVSRHLARPAVERRLGGSARFAAVDRAIGRRGFRVVLLLRLSPVLPFNVMNYALGLTRVRFAHYVLASVGMLPGTLLYVYYGKVVGDVAALAAGSAVEQGPEYYAVLALGLLATIVLTIYLTRLTRRALREETDDGTLADGG